MSDAGRALATRGSTSMTAATTATTASVQTQVGVPPPCTTPSTTLPSTTAPDGQSAAPTERTAVTRVLCPVSAATPTAAGTCCRKMIAAMPRVKPSTTGHGM
jgi:hypothetical protein